MLQRIRVRMVRMLLCLQIAASWAQLLSFSFTDFPVSHSKFCILSVLLFGVIPDAKSTSLPSVLPSWASWASCISI